VILGKRNWMSAAGVVCRASAGASEMLDIFVCDESEKSVGYLKERGYKVVCADIENSISLYECPLKRPLLVVIGGEKRGITRAVLSECDKVVCLDYGRRFGAALSAASAASILAFEIYRQNRTKGE
jgi:23S rRNA (guanosine2251-2'-O)-methyltransferase